MKLLYLLESLRTPAGDWLMSGITHLGGETAFLAVAIFIFWCVDKHEGYYLLTVGFLGTVLNQFLKLLCRIPRPWVLDPDFTIVESARAEATGYSFPSGHTQNAVGTFGGIARATKRHCLRWVCVVIFVLVSFSRMYLGVHTPLDVGVSFVIAAVLVFAIYPLMRRADRYPRLMAGLLASMVLLSAAYLTFTLVYPFPPDIDSANLASGVENGWKLLGATLGIALAWWLDRQYVHFETKAVWWVQAIKFIVGLALIVALKAGLKAPLIALFGGSAGLAGAVRYFLVVLAAGVLWPMAFRPLSRLGQRGEG